jgi:hypothetical protein
LKRRAGRGRADQSQPAKRAAITIDRIEVGEVVERV